MAETHKFVLTKPSRLLYSSVTEKSAPKGVQGAIPKFGGTFGIEKEDFDLIVPIMVEAIKVETGGFTNPQDYFLACMSGITAGKRAIAKAELDASANGVTADQAFKIRENAQKRAELYRPYAGILIANSQYDISLAQLVGGVVKDITEPHAIAQAGKDLFYAGAVVVPSIAFKAFRRKTLDAKDGCTAYLQNCLHIRKGEKIGGMSAPNNEVFGNYAGYSETDPTALAPGAAEDEPAF